MTIKEAAGKVLLILYYLQTSNPVDLETKSIAFSGRKLRLQTDSKLKKMLHEICDDDVVLYNAFSYLLSKGLIAKKNTKNILGGMLLIGLHLTDDGIDVIEGVEQGKIHQQTFKSLFNLNFNFTSNVKVDSLLKAEVGNIVGIGGAVSGKATIK